MESGEAFETMLARARVYEDDRSEQVARELHPWYASISLDTVEELGTFAEIEVIAGNENENPTATIEEIAKDIGVEGEPILESYLELLLARRKAGRE